MKEAERAAGKRVSRKPENNAVDANANVQELNDFGGGRYESFVLHETHHAGH
jgi:hypothetical protein